MVISASSFRNFVFLFFAFSFLILQGFPRRLDKLDPLEFPSGIAVPGRIFSPCSRNRARRVATLCGPRHKDASAPASRGPKTQPRGPAHGRRQMHRARVIAQIKSRPFH